jgi:hypothetical protein
MMTMTTTGLGPARVTAIHDDTMRVLTEAGEADAVLALAYPYAPEVGDIVLVIGEDQRYVIGVLRGRGKSRFVAPGDLELHARGEVQIFGERGVEIRSPRLLLRADKVETIAQVILERAHNAYRWVKDLVQTYAGRQRTVVEGSSLLNAERILERAEKEVKIDGSKVLLG